MRGVRCALVACLLLPWSRARAQEPAPDVEIPDFVLAEEGDDSDDGDGPRGDISIDDVVRASVYSVSKKPQLVRESPGVVTIITREEIINSGARDLDDVLLLVPGFFFGVDVQGGIGVGFRGLWGQEGKVLLLIDGQEMNELSYSTLQFGNHYPVEHIEKIEIIRGPGSVIYGGFAELAVINVTTRGAAALSGAAVAGNFGQMVGGSGALGRASASVSAGDEIGDFSISVAGIIGQGNRSDGVFRDASGMEIGLEENAQLDPMFLNVGLGYRDLKLRFLFDNYSMTTLDGFGDINPTADRTSFEAILASAEYNISISDNLVVTPRVSYKRQRPWKVTDTSSDYYSDKINDRALGGISVAYDILPNVNLLTGAEAYIDRGKLNDPSLADMGLNTSFGGEADQSYNNVAAFGQLGVSHSIANLTVGARWERHNQFGQSFVPRAGITKVIGRFHAKLLASTAFRAPGFENINSNPDIEPERTVVYELETGVQLNDHMFVSVNAFDTTIDKPIVYDIVPDPDTGEDVEGYFNFDQLGSRGVELDYKLRYPWGYVSASGSYYNAAGKNKVELYAVPDKDYLLLAFPAFKGALNSGFNIWRGLVVSPSLVFLSSRYGFGELGADEEQLLLKEKPVLISNLFVRWSDLFVRGFEIGAGVHNAFDREDVFIQPYAGGHPPLPGSSRELLARVGYTYPF
jgi:outer membrane cobalamin receptor